TFRVAFYETTFPFRPNVLVDITPFELIKSQAIQEYQSQLRMVDYHAKILELNRFRSLTLPPGANLAEAFWLVEAAEVGKGLFSLVYANQFQLLDDHTVTSTALVSVIIRTYNRHDRLRQALTSVFTQSYRRLEVIVVNDGGEEVDPGLAEFRPGLNLIGIRHRENQGRSAAANSGLRAATGNYVTFLDDDDYWLPDHVATLVEGLTENGHQVAYTDCACVRVEPGAESNSRSSSPPIKIFSEEFDRDRFLFENYIPTICLMFSRQILADTGYFDEDLEIYEDWDYWIRLSRLVDFKHIPKVTAEYRIYPGAGTGVTGSSHDVWFWTAKVVEKNRQFISGAAWVRFARDYLGPKLEFGEGCRDILRRYPFAGPEAGPEEGPVGLPYDSPYQVNRLDMFRARLNHLMADRVHLNATVADQTAELRDKDCSIKELQHAVNELQGRTVTLNHLVSEQRAVLDEIFHSLGWMILQYYRNTRERLKQWFRKSKPSPEVPPAEAPHPAGPDQSYDQLIRAKEAGEINPDEIRREITGFAFQPLISLIMPTYNTPAEWLNRAINSVRGQLYPNWQLCLADDGSTAEETISLLKNSAEADHRIKIAYLKENLGISGASNQALALAEGEFVGLLDHDDELAPTALYENVKLLQGHPDADMIYSDEDKLTPDGLRVEPYFKPDWAPDQLLSHMYTCHFGLYRRELVLRVGGFRPGYEGSQDYDLVLRLTEQTDRIYHIPKVLYHWRMIPGSTAADYQAKGYADQAALKALNDALTRRGIQGEVGPGLFPGSFRVKRAVIGRPMVSIIIPFKNKQEYLERCLDSIKAKTDYDHYEILLINNGSDDPATLDYLDGLKGRDHIRMFNYAGPFNFSAINNWAVARAAGEHVLFLNNDTEVTAGEWLRALLEHSQRPEVGAVGAKLLYPDNRIQHGGVVLGLGGIAGHPHKYLPADDPGYFGQLSVIRNFSALTAACLMMRRRVFDEMGGFDERNLSIAFNDVDLCLRIREKGYYIIYTPFALLYHHESVSRGYEDTPEKAKRFQVEIDYMRRRWGAALTSDPYYNPNLSLEKHDLSFDLGPA
ncbi:MAG: glycosyltransferase, partial [Deltaproteobacteria bacterium]|nr:glycosyltransferase [Deltaproteobacteria bacterium]